MQIDHTDISGMGKRVGKDSLTLRWKEEVTTKVTSSFSIYYVDKVLSCKTLHSRTCLIMTTANPAPEGYRAFANSQV